MEASNTENSIAHEIGGLQNDTLRFGLHSVKGEITGSHPLQSAYQSTKEMHEQRKRRALLNSYGSAFPLKMDLDRQMLSRFQRPPGQIPSSMLGLEALTGTLEDFGFEDYLNDVAEDLFQFHFDWLTLYLDPRESETFRPLDMHHGMEVRLGVSKGPVCPSFI
ncbi:hypothetical protein RHSIM_Rhsim10G0064100 [Rhododendron simsii]|uniref:Uncharacterized protein n=1 Tax=Rhododendron simsii TaxID=118357 RepID=A0A834GD01_RHOSS|nr:hypothetical protein RHSIM_Rhsim10G0064100 [Rhododendron simsii]